MRNFTILLAVAAVLALAGSAWAAAYYPRYDWTLAADGDWETAGNWTETLATGQTFDPPNSPPPFHYYRHEPDPVNHPGVYDYIYGKSYIENGQTVTAGNTFSIHTFQYRVAYPGGKFYLGDATGNSKLVIDIGNAPEKTFYGSQSYVGYSNGAGSMELKSGTYTATGTSNCLYVGASGSYTGTYTQTGGEFRFYALNVGSNSSNANGEVHISGGHMYNNDSRAGILVGHSGGMGYGYHGTGLFHVEGSWDWDYGSGAETARIDVDGDFRVAPHSDRYDRDPDKDSTVWFEFETNSAPAVTKIICAADVIFGYGDNGTPGDPGDDKGALLKLSWVTGATPVAFTDYLVISGDYVVDDGLRLHPDTDANWSFRVIAGTDDGAAGDGQLLVSYVPEPATLTLLGIGLVGVILRRKRR
ncbi:MAG: PEP-CTERM sorting domain-containing protein [Phycisphaerae bacterium]|nr:PEP-CTERM sorting domain-containing protein [Phycisphaerae bacterium]